MRERVAIVCDFDGTITLADLGDQISIEFSGADHWRAAEDDYKDGRINFRELLQTIFRPISVGKSEVEDFAKRTAIIREGFEHFVSACIAQRAPFLVCSAGLDVYVEAVLGSLDPAVKNHIEVRSNRAVFRNDHLDVVFDDPSGGCGNCGLCKQTVVLELRQKGYRVVVFGDGTSDRCAARVADHVFACGKLAAFCASEGIPYTAFDSFSEIASDTFWTRDCSPT